MTAKNLDDVDLDILKLRSAMTEEKEQISAVEAKLGLIDHLLSDTVEIKTAGSKTADRIERRLQKIEELLAANKKLKKKAPEVSQMAISLALQGYDTKKKSVTPPLERSYSFGMFHVPKRDPNKPDFSFGQDEAEFENLRGWVKAIKELPPALEQKYYDLHMMSSRSLIKTEPEEQLP